MLTSLGDLPVPPSGAPISTYPPSDQQVASYMRSVLTNLITPGQPLVNSGGHEPDSRYPAYPAPPGDESIDHRGVWQSGGGGFVKVKAEPRSRSRTLTDLPTSSQDHGSFRRSVTLRRPRRPSPPRPDDTGEEVRSLKRLLLVLIFHSYFKVKVLMEGRFLIHILSY